jgi:hypothetical protein
MKGKLRIVLIAGLFIAVPLQMMAQQPPHPNSGNAPGAENGPVGGGAPVGGGLTLLLAMGAAFGLRKIGAERNQTPGIL